MSNMRFIVGLGNPGKEYEKTRHNIGFRVVDFLSGDFGGSFAEDKKFQAEVSEIEVGGEKIVLAKPKTFMNNSGQAVKKLTDAFCVEPEDMIIVHDDLDIPFGRIKVSLGRGSAGHKGVESIIRVLKTGKFYRVRIGTFNKEVEKIKKSKSKKETDEIDEFVTSPFSPVEKRRIMKIIKEAASRIISLL